MSLTNNKAALFATSKDGNAAKKTSSAAPVSKTAGSTASYSATRTAGNSTTSAASSAMSSQKIADAKGFVEKAQGFLKTSFMQWSPDYLAAAPMYEKASDAYKQAGDYYNALQMMLRCVECHDGYGSSSSAAVAWTKAAQISRSNLKDPRQTSQFLTSAAECWAQNGDIAKYGENYSKAGKELEEVDGEQALELYNRGLSILYPADTRPEQMSHLPPVLPDILRNVFSLYIRLGKLSEAIAFGYERAVVFFESAEMENSAHKILAAITIMQLKRGDIAKAQQDFAQEHLNCRGYLRSKESELADDLLRAFNTNDAELLQKCKYRPEMNFLGQEATKLGRALELPLVVEEDSPPTADAAADANADGADVDGAAAANLDNLRISEDTSNKDEIVALPDPPREHDTATAATTTAPQPPTAAGVEEEQEEEQEEEEEDEVDLS